MSRSETISTFANHKRDSRCLARILGVDRVPTDKRGNLLCYVVEKSLPDSAFKRGFYGMVYTPRVANCNRSGMVLSGRRGFERGADDSCYKNHPHMVRILPRCYSILMIFRASDDVCVAKHILQGYYKFGGSAKDEDSNISTSGLFEQAPLHEATRVVLSEKSNGKAGVFTMFEFQNELYLFAGSKTQHFVVHVNDRSKRDSDIGSMRRDFAREMIVAFFKDWDTLSQENKDKFAAQLVGSDHDDGFTACGEFEDGKHMVPLPKGQGPTNKMFGLVANRGVIPERETFCEDVVSSVDWFKERGFQTITVSTKLPSEIEKTRTSLRAGRMHEGVVLHYQMQDKKTGNWVTIAVEKYKKNWYILLRVCREFIKRPPDGWRNWQRKLKERLEKRNRDFLDLPYPFLMIWYDLLVKFINWFRDVKRYEVNEIDINASSRGMGAVWNEFIEETGENDDLLEPEAELKKRGISSNGRTGPSSSRGSRGSHGDYESKQSAESKSQGSSTPPKGLLVVMQGIPGIGKTFITNYLIEQLSKRDIPSIGLEQDPFALKHGLRKAGAVCLDAFKDMVRGGKHKVIFLQRNNACLSQYRKYANFAHDNNWLVHVISPENLHDTPHLTLICLQSVCVRDKHDTFNDLELGKRVSITMAFLNVFEYPPTNGSGHISHSHRIDWITRGAENEPIDSSVSHSFENLNRRWKNNKNAFDVNVKNSIVTELNLLKGDYQKWRRSPEDISADIASHLEATSLRSLMGKTSTSTTTPTQQSSTQSQQKQNVAQISQIFSDISIPKNVSSRDIPRKDVVYIGLKLDEDARSKLSKCLVGLEKVDCTGLTETKLHHLTLIFKNARESHADLWAELVAYEGRQLCAYVKGVAYSPNNINCFVCEIYSEFGHRKGTSLLRLCESGHPHITARHARSVSPVESLNLLTRLSTHTKKENEGYVSVEEPFPIMCTITLFGGGGGGGRGGRGRGRGGGKRRQGGARRQYRRKF